MTPVKMILDDISITDLRIAFKKSLMKSRLWVRLNPKKWVNTDEARATIDDVALAITKSPRLLVYYKDHHWWTHYLIALKYAQLIGEDVVKLVQDLLKSRPREKEEDLLPALVFEGKRITIEGDMLSLTDMWNANGSDENQRPVIWLRFLETQNFLNTFKKQFKGDPGSLLKSAKGKYGGTFAHWQIALAYAKYLSPKFHIRCNEIIKERFEEAADPELGIVRAKNRAIETYRKRGKSDAWIAVRLDAIEIRKDLVGEVLKNDNGPKAIGIVTNSIYRALFGAPASRLKKELGAKNIRDHLTTEAVLAVSIIENAAKQRYEVKRIASGAQDEIALKDEAKRIATIQRAALQEIHNPDPKF